MKCLRHKVCILSRSDHTTVLSLNLNVYNASMCRCRRYAYSRSALDRSDHDRAPKCTFEAGTTQALVLMAFAGLPTASSAYVLAARMGHNGPFVAGLVTLSTLLGMASLPLALSLAGMTPP